MSTIFLVVGLENTVSWTFFFDSQGVSPNLLLSFPLEFHITKNMASNIPLPYTE